MREIKFRGLSRNGQWVYGSYIETAVDAPAIIFGDGEQVEVLPETVGQLTGLKDVKGTEIYEGDIVVHLNTRGYPDLAIGQIEWENFRSQFRHSRFSEEYLSGSSLEVIGNTSEHPHILGKEQRNQILTDTFTRFVVHGLFSQYCGRGPHKIHRSTC